MFWLQRWTDPSEAAPQVKRPDSKEESRRVHPARVRGVETFVCVFRVQSFFFKKGWCSMSFHLPVTGILSSLAAALGLYTLYWYENLSKEEKREADALAAEYASNLYDKGLNALTSAQLRHVQELVKGHFAA
jgi:hypothetical protein